MPPYKDMQLIELGRIARAEAAFDLDVSKDAGGVAGIDCELGVGHSASTSRVSIGASIKAAKSNARKSEFVNAILGVADPGVRACTIYGALDCFDDLNSEDRSILLKEVIELFGKKGPIATYSRTFARDAIIKAKYYIGGEHLNRLDEIERDRPELRRFFFEGVQAFQFRLNRAVLEAGFYGEPAKPLRVKFGRSQNADLTIDNTFAHGANDEGSISAKLMSPLRSIGKSISAQVRGFKKQLGKISADDKIHHGKSSSI